MTRQARAQIIHERFHVRVLDMTVSTVRLRQAVQMPTKTKVGWQGCSYRGGARGRRSERGGRRECRLQAASRVAVGVLHAERAGVHLCMQADSASACATPGARAPGEQEPMIGTRARTDNASPSSAGRRHWCRTVWRGLWHAVHERGARRTHATRLATPPVHHIAARKKGKKKHEETKNSEKRGEQ